MEFKNILYNLPLNTPASEPVYFSCQILGTPIVNGGGAKIKLIVKRAFYFFVSEFLCLMFFSDLPKSEIHPIPTYYEHLLLKTFTFEQAIYYGIVQRTPAKISRKKISAMKKIFLTMLITSSAMPGFSQFKIPAPSPTQTIIQDFGLSNIKLVYSRPGIKGRKMIGKQVPWNVVWRTGANTATLITFGSPVEILGHKIDSGTYALYTIPRENGNWSFILNTGIHNWGANGYKENEDLFRQTVETKKYPAKAETLSMQFTNVEQESCVLNIRWDYYELHIPIALQLKDQLRKNLEVVLNSNAEKKPYFEAAQFYNEWDHNPAKALEMINKAIAQTSTPPFFVVYYKAKLQEALGDKKGAMETSEWSMKLSKATNSTNYIILNNVLQKELQ